MDRIRRILKQQQAFLLYFFLGIFVRIFNFRNTLFFTWDQGRDAFVLEKIANGSPILIGPTSGLPGFFLGPLWNYLGVPGILLSRGNPYGISLWYVLLACLALPLFWIISHRLFTAKRLALLSSYLLAFIPGSVAGSVMIWNPLITLPLMSAAFLALWKGRSDQRWLWVGFFLLALNLQAEFAYAIFFIIPLFILIPWIRQKFDWRDFIGSGLAIFLTLIPQLAFEIRHNWIMTRSLLRALADPDRMVAWEVLLQKRPAELYWYSVKLFFGGWGEQAMFLAPFLLGAFVLGIFRVWKRRGDSKTFGWQLLALMAIIPYPFFLFWRGNYGNFFGYYLTPHFIFLTPIIIYGLLEFVRGNLGKSIGRFFHPRDWAVLLIGVITTASVLFITGNFLERNNQAGLQSMERAVDTIYDWSESDGINQPLVRIFTPNLQTEHYDYLFKWKAKQLDRPVPLTVTQGNEQKWYILTEPDNQLHETRFLPWYKEATGSGKLVRSEQVGVLTVETWSAAQ